MSKASNNWLAMDEESQLSIAKHAIENQYQKLIKLPNVIVLGYGFKEIQGKLTKEVCIKASVSFKRKSKQKKGKIPERILTYWADKSGIRKAYLIPTDIVLIKTIRLHNIGVGGASTLTRKQNKVSTGTACCYVKFHHAENYFYILGCAHTFALMENYYQPQVNNFPEYLTHYSHYTGQQYKLGKLQVIAAFPQVDAAIIHVENTQILTSGFGPQNYAFKGAWVHDYMPNQFNIHTKDGPIPYQIDGYTKQLNLTYFNKQEQQYTYTFYNIPTAKPIQPGVSTTDGDSGAPVITSDGILIGMHFAGAGIYSYFIPIKWIFNAFGPYSIYLYA